MLQDSHIFPKFAVKPLKAEKGHLLEINGTGRYGVKKVQDGFKEFLLCEACEGLCSREYERPFAAAWKKFAPPEPWSSHKVLERKVDYARFKLFHLLNLFRASVSSAREFQEVQLGPHEEVIRKMLLSGDAGPAEQYAVAAMVVYSATDGSLAGMISPPRRHRSAGRTSYSTIYLSIEWTVLVSAGGSEAIRHRALRDDGSIQLVGWPWQQHMVTDDVARALAGKEMRGRE